MLCDKRFSIAKNPKYDRHQNGFFSMLYIFLSMFYIFFNVLYFFLKKTSGAVFKGEIMPNQQLAEELHKPVIRKLEKRKVHSSFVGNIWDGDQQICTLMYLIENFDFCYALLIFIVKIHVLFP